MSELKESTKQEKLQIIDRVLNKYENIGQIDYLCDELFEAAYRLLPLSEAVLDYSWHTEVCIILIPELLKIKPDNVNTFSLNGWFGCPNAEGATERRIDALRDLREIIEKQNATPEAVRGQEEKQ
jgi:hypothetical protein